MHADTTINDAEMDLAVDRHLADIDLHDVLDELEEAGDQLMLAIKRNDAPAIGRIVMATRRALALRRAQHELIDGGPNPAGVISAQMAASMALYGAVAL